MRVLIYGLGGNVRGGIETFLLNMNANMSDDCVFDYVIEDDGSHDTIHRQMIENRGGRILFIAEKRSLIANLRDWEKVLKNEKQSTRIVYFNIYSLSWLPPIWLATKAGYRVIVHAHNNMLHNCGVVVKYLHYINRLLQKPMNICRLTNSKLSSAFMFGNEDAAEIIYNAINVDRFVFDQSVRDDIRSRLSVQDKHVFGFSGRIMYQKNPLFLIAIFEQISKMDAASILLIAGDGDLVNEMKASIDGKGLQDKVVLLGNVNNIEDYYQAMDVYMLPSRFEGLGIVLIEAQASGLPCLTSADVVAQEAKVTEQLRYISLNSSPMQWAQAALDAYHGRDLERVKFADIVRKSRFNIVTEAKYLENQFKES